MNGSFRFDLGQEVKIIASGEIGHVIGRAEYSESACSYYIRYMAADGRAVEQWWNQAALIETK